MIEGISVHSELLGDVSHADCARCKLSADHIQIGFRFASRHSLDSRAKDRQVSGGHRASDQLGPQAKVFRYAVEIAFMAACLSSP